ncbi:alpha/beta fold hydrolase [Amycolatopsis sp. K13G38]|uniref:Alpha/beta fold hydrolase n=1 Tax=Amycolatopsis acididurans TaxID=2724524 RepID=A0ABX1J1S4_9PSEU|nr:alpha/beta fold hydrolase [Amycolatopsis acididurans]NKQ53717.1 alpha/beta fold hydrolase [Amycolatopsis acididurans]
MKRIAAVLITVLTSLFVPAVAASAASGCQPVVLLHGLGANGPGNFAYLSPYLQNAGYCPFTFTYGQASPAFPVGGTIPIEDSARQIKEFIDHVRATTGAAKVDVVGHSEGGFQSLYGPKMLGYAGEIGHVVALAPPTHGTDVAGTVAFADYLGLRPSLDTVLSTFGCQSCPEMLPGGSAVDALTAGPIAQPGIDYTIIASQLDAVVTPHETSFVREPGVHNLFVQDYCPADPVGHVGLAFDSAVAGLVLGALNPGKPVAVQCAPGPPL